MTVLETEPGPPMTPSRTAPGRRVPWLALAALGLVAAGAAVTLVPRFLSNDPGDEAEGVTLAPPVAIDGDRAYRYLKDLCAIGPRPAGSASNAKQRSLVAKHFAALGAKVTEQPFRGKDPRSGAELSMVNLIGSWNPDRRQRVVLGVHYDTRPFPDEDPDPARRTSPFLGANDGASGVALLMELAHHLKSLTTPWGVDLVLFDGEEIVYGRGRQQNGEYFLGSKEFAARYAAGVEARSLPFQYVAGLVLDMVGDRNLRIDQEDHSVQFAPDLVRDVWSVARRVKATAFRNQVGPSVMDDHLPLNNAGIPAIDIIDFDYPYWHTSQDLPEHCSGASLEQVGRVVAAWLAQPRRRTR